ncbi:MAG: adenosylcobinamide-GDP ribazoletransferase [Pseudomonadota bacterium]
MSPRFFSRPRAGFCAAVSFCTRWPVGHKARTGPLPKGAVADGFAWFPCVGALTGLLAAIVASGLMALGMSVPLAILLALSAHIVMTGGLHEDGLADTLDGMSARGARAIEIMRDSHLGTYGALGLMLALALRALALIEVATAGAGFLVVAWMLAGGLSRLAMVTTMAVSAPATQDGVAAAMPEVRPPILALAAISVLLGAWLGTSLAIAVSLTAGAMGLGWLVAQGLKTWLGGMTGDTLGACQQAAEILALLACLRLL